MNNSSKTVLFISHDSSNSGAPIFLLRFLSWFRKQRTTPFRILIGQAGGLLPDFESLAPADLFEPKATPLQEILRRLGWARKADNSRHLALLRQKLSESNIGLIYSNTIVNGHILDFLSFLNCPVICHVHELQYAIGNAGEENLKLIKKYTSSYIAVSQAVKRNLIENLGIPAERIRTIHGFIPIDATENKINDSGTDVRRELGISRGARLVGACGTIEPRKGVDLFLRVANRVKELYKAAPVHFLWVGGWPREVRRARKDARSLSVQDIVHFIGRRPNVNAYYDASDIFLLPSREDPFPLVMLEAAWRGKPVICFDDTGGAPEFVEHDAGFVVPKFDVDEMAKKVIELLDRNELRERLGETAKNKVASLHGLNAGGAKIADCIEEVLTSGTRQYARP